MSTNVGTLRTTLVADTGRFKRDMRSSSMTVKGFADTVKTSMGGSVAAIGAVGVAVAGIAVGVKTAQYAFRKMAETARNIFRFMLTEARGFNKEMHASLAIMGNVSASMKNRMGMAALRLSYNTQFSGKEGAAAYYYLASAGLTPGQSVKAMPTVGTFAQAGNFDLSRATDLLTDAQSALGMKDMARVGDVLVKANTLANASVEQFSESLTNKAGAALRLLKKDIEEGVAVLAVYADQGLKGAESGTALGIVLRDLQTKAIKHAGAFKAAGVEVYNASGNMRNMADIIHDLEQSLEGMSDKATKAALLDLGFSDKSVSFIQSLLGTSDKIRQYEKGLRDAKGTMAEVASKQMPALTRAWEKLKAVTEAAAVVTMVPVLDSLGETVDDLIPPFEMATNAIKVFAAETVYAFRMAYYWAIKFLRLMPNANLVVPKLPEGFRARTDALRVSMSQPINIDRLSPATEGGPESTAPTKVDDVDEAAEKARKKLMAAGEALTLKLRTPMEVFAQNMARYSELLGAGAISQTTFERARLAAMGGLMPSGGAATSNAAIEYGTQAYYAAEAARRDQATRERYMQEQIALLEEIADNTGDDEQ